MRAMNEKQRGVDLDAIVIHPPLAPEAIRPVVDAVMARENLRPLESIDAIQLDSLLEWCEPTERCVAVAHPASADENGPQWQLVYDTRFCSLALTQALAAAFPQATIFYFNLQEDRDGTLAIFRNGTRMAFCADARMIEGFSPYAFGALDAVAYKAALPVPFLGGNLRSDMILGSLETVVARTPSEPHPVSSGKKGRLGGVYNALQVLARAANMPRLYRFFEGWMRSDLDWDEDNIEAVWAYSSREDAKR
jgi:hypothetical protein